MLIKASLFFLPLAPAIVSAGLLPHRVALAPRADVCGVKGYDRDNGNYFWSASKPLASYAGCSAQCAESDRCESFGFSDEGCMLFELPLAENFDEDQESDVTYFDAGCIQDEDSTPSTKNASIPLTRTTTVSTATRTVTRSIALATATGTGAPLRPVNGTGFFPMHRTATGHRHPHAPTRAFGSVKAAAPTPRPSPTQSPAADTSDTSKGTQDGSSSGLGAGSQSDDGILPQTSNSTLANNGNSIVLNNRGTGKQASRATSSRSRVMRTTLSWY